MYRGIACSMVLMPMTLLAIFAGEWTQYGGWEGGYFRDGNNCYFYDPAQNYYDFYCPPCHKRCFEKIAEPCPKLWRGELIFQDNDWGYQVSPGSQGQ